LPVVDYLRWWDKVAAQRPDKIIAISTEVQKRITKYYNRESEIIFPPVDLHRKNSLLRNGSYFLIHGRFEPYKRLDLVINVFKNIDKQLVVSGSGSEFDKYKHGKFKNIKFIEKPTDIELFNLYSGAKAFLMPQDEDFGITSVEAQSFGVPVIAFKSGGAQDTVVDGVTGLFFEKQTMSSLKQVIAKFDTMSFNRESLIKNAEKFSKDRFKRELQRSLVRSYSSWRGRNSSLAKI
jgi:glycosyltransferase involved in cell wall biosynthesis